MMNFSSKQQPIVIISLIFILSALIRSFHLFHGMGFHPDERGIQMILSNISWTNLNPKNFHYGSFAYYQCWLTAQFIKLFYSGLGDYDLCFRIGRIYAVIYGSGCCVVLYALVKKITLDIKTAQLAAFLLATNIFHLQLSRFYTVDILLTTLSLIALYACYLTVYDNKWNKIFGVFLGLAFTNKISALSLLVPYIVALLIKASRSSSFKNSIKLISVNFLEVVFFSILVVVMVEPFLFLDFKEFIANNKTQIDMVKGSWVPPYTLQYVGTTPYLYHLIQIFYYTVGLPVSMLALIGFLMMLYQAIKKFDSGYCILLSWVLAVFFSVAGFQVKFPRYLLPIYPIMLFLAAYPFSFLSNEKRRIFSGFLILVCFLQSLDWISIYSKPHIYNAASDWIYRNIPNGQSLAHLHWDDHLPIDLVGHNPGEYSYPEVKIYETDNQEKINSVAEILSSSDYLVFPTAKFYNALNQVRDRFPFTSKFIKALATEQIGYKLAAQFKDHPSLQLNDIKADESLSIYDHPQVAIYKNEKKLSKDKIIEEVNKISLANEEDLRLFQAR